MNELEFEKLLKFKETEIRRLKKEKNTLEKENCDLKKKLLMYENAHTPPSKSKKKRIPRESSGKLGAPKGHQKHERETPEPTEIKRHTIDSCPHCNYELTTKEILESIEEETPDLQTLKIIKHLIEWSVCPNCKKRVVAKNDAPVERFGPNLRTHMTLLKHEDRLPYRKIVGTLKRNFDLTLSHAGIIKIIRGVSKKLEIPYYEIIKKVRSSKVVYVDETQYKLNGETWWLWTFVTQDETLFVIRQSRSKKVIEEVLGKKFKGIIVCDGWSAYPSFADALQRCWAHLLRESFQLKEDNKDLEKFHNQITELFKDIKETREKPPDIEERRNLVEKMKKRLTGIYRRMEKHNPAKTLSTKIKNGMNYWFTCVEHLGVEPTNNFAEQSLRELIVQRKIMGGLRSEKGAETLEIISTLLATWKKEDKPLFETLKSYL